MAAFIVSAGLSWVSFGLLQTDSQLWPLLFGMNVVFWALLRGTDVEFGVVLFLPAAALLIGWSYILLGGASVDGSLIRALISAFTFAACYWAYSECVRWFPRRLNWLVVVNILWLVAAVLQIMIGRDALDLVLAARTTDDRGVTGLAVEPTYFALFLIIISWLLLVEEGYRPSRRVRWLMVVNVLFVIFAALSATGVVYLALAGVLVAGYRGFWRVVAGAAILGGVVAALVAANVGEDYRVVQLLLRLDLPLEMVRLDASINVRIGHALAPWAGAWDNLFLPGGFWQFAEYYARFKSESGGFFWHGGEQASIMSWLGSLVYEYGALSFIAMGFIVWCVWDGTRRSLYELAMLFAVLIVALPIAFPFIPMLLAAMRLRRRSPWRSLHLDSASSAATGVRVSGALSASAHLR